MQLSFEVLSSGSGTYRIDVTFADGRVNVMCNCEAGKRNVLCKHKLSILRKEYKLLVNNQDFMKVDEIHLKVKSSSLQILLNDLEVAEVALKEAEANLKSARKKLGKALSA